jgi:alpha-N-arabinofuranosidase
MVSGRIHVDLKRRKSIINPQIYGNFVEHLGRCIYGGIYDEGSSLSDEHGFRRDVMQAVRELCVPILRYPGGNFVSGYHWEDGVGPRGERPRRRELAWNTIESNRFGTDEFVEYCRLIHTDPYICVNLGNGTIQEAANWVEYCNGVQDSYYSDLRRKHGYNDPHRVKYWGLGNEVYGEWQIGHKNVKDYATIALEAAKVMKWTDSRIQLIAVGTDNNDWNLEVLRRLYPIIDYISFHLYIGSPEYNALMAQTMLAEAEIKFVSDAISFVKRELKSKKDVKIAFDEWNVWYRSNPITGPEEHYDLADALAVACYLNAFQRNCGVVTMANMAQLVNIIAPIFTRPDGLFLQTIYYPLKLYAEHSGNIALDAWCESDGFSTENLPQDILRGIDIRVVPFLDTSVTFNEAKKRISVHVVNRNNFDEVVTQIRLSDVLPASEARVFEINGADIRQKNSFDEPDNVKINIKKIDNISGKFEYAFPPHSVTMLEAQL